MTPRPQRAFACLCVLISLNAGAFNFELLQQNALKRFGAAGSAAIRDWQSALSDSKSRNEIEKLRFINAYVNGRVTHLEDRQIWSQEDYWATPLETLSRGQGDCEDYVIAKYFSLKHLGVPVAKLRLTYVRARIGGPSSTLMQAHMILAFYSSPDAEPLVLDNLISEIRPASRRPDLTPVFSFNNDGVFITGAQSGASPESSSGLTRWRDLLTRMQSEGFDVDVN